MTDPCPHISTIIETKAHLASFVSGFTATQNEIKADIKCIKDSLMRIREDMARDEGRYDGEERRKNTNNTTFIGGIIFAFTMIGAAIGAGIKPIISLFANR